MATCRLPLVAASGPAFSLLLCVGFSLWWLLLLRSTGSRYTQASVVLARRLVAPPHVESSQIRYRNHVPRVGRCILFLFVCFLADAF